MRNFGFQGIDDVARVGTNAKLSEAGAAMGLTSLESVDSIIALNRANYHAYAEVFLGTRGCKLIRYEEQERRNYQYAVIETNETVSGISRDDLIRVLQSENVRARRYFYPGCHRMEPYRTQNPDAGRLLPETERIAERVICLPNGTAVTPDTARRIRAIVRFAVDHGPEIAERLARQRRHAG